MLAGRDRRPADPRAGLPHGHRGSRARRGQAHAVSSSDRPLKERLGAFSEIDDALASLTVPFDEWETLYRERLQVERDLLAAAVGQPAGPPGAPGASGTAGTEGGGHADAALDDDGRDVPRGQQLVGLAGMALLAVYGLSLLIDRVLPGRRD